MAGWTPVRAPPESISIRIRREPGVPAAAAASDSIPTTESAPIETLQRTASRARRTAFGPRAMTG